jgi:hypothetical protein
MKLKHILTTLFLMLSLSIIYSQDIKIKKGDVFIDEVKCLTIDGSPINFSFYNLEGEEIFILKYIDDNKNGSYYCKVTFLNQKLSFTSKTYIFTKKDLIKKLLQSKVLVNCNLMEDKVENFVLKYDENIESDNINVNISIDRN